MGCQLTDQTTIGLLRARISKRARDPRLALVPGLADDLTSIGEAFVLLEHQVELLSAGLLAEHCKYGMPPADWNAIVDLANRRMREDA